MEITENLNEGLSRSYTLTATAEEVDERVTKKLKEIGLSARIKGFRPGKAPVSVLRSMYGKRTLANVRIEVVQEGIKDHLAKKDEMPVRQPNVELKNSPDDPDINIEFSYECTPVIPEVDLSSIRIERPEPVVDEKEVTKALEGYASAHPIYVERQSDEGACLEDKVVVSFTATVDEAPVDRLNATDFPAIIGSETLIPGFEQQLLGAKAGDRRTVEVTIPSNHSDKKIAGKQALFDCEISAVSCPQTREIDQELAGLLGFASLDEMKESVRENLKVDSEVIAEQIAKARLLEELVQRLDFELPPIVLKDEVDRIRQALEQPQAGEQPEEPTGDDEDQNARGVGQENGETGNPTGNEANPEQVAGGEESPDSPGDPDGNSRESDDELHRIATRRLRTAFLFTQIAKEQGISVSEGDMYKEYCTNYRPVALKVWKDQMMPNQQWRDTWYGVCLEKKVADWVLTQVNVTEKSASLDEIATMSRALES